MDIRPELQLKTMIKAMVDVVLPAVDKQNPAAQEQAQLVIGTLSQMMKRLPILYRYDRDELDRYIKLSNELASAVRDRDAAVVRNLKAQAVHGADVLQRARAEPAELEGAVTDMRAAVGQLIEFVYAQPDAASRSAVKKLVLLASKVELDRERAWAVDLGFETDPSTIPPPIEKQLQSSVG